MAVGGVESSVLRPLVSPLIVGRDAELSALRDAATHPPSLIVVEGEAGVGKSRLVAELLRLPELRAQRRLIGRSQQLHEQFRLAPLVQAMRAAGPLQAGRLSRATGALRALIPELEHLPQPPLELAGGHIIERHLLFRAVVDLLRALGRTVLVLEDMHWADPETVDLILFVAAQAPPGLTLVLTYRRQELPEDSPLLSVAARLEPGARGGKVLLGPLSREHVGALLAAILETGTVSDEFAGFVHDRTGGIPFAVEEVLRLMIDSGAVVSHQGRWIRRGLQHIGVPTAIRDSVLQRCAGLSRDARVLIEAAAVCDDTVAAPLALGIAGVEPAGAGAALREALRSGVLIEDSAGAVGFRHVLARDAVYDSIPHLERRQQHVRAARELARSGEAPVATIAYHYKCGGDARWLALAEEAADGAEAVRDYEAAVRLLADLLGSAELPRDDRFRVAAKLGWAASRGMVRDPRTAQLLAAALEDAELSDVQRGELRFLHGFLVAFTGDATRAHDAWRQAVDELGDAPLAARVMIVLADPWVFEGTLDEHMGWLQRAAEAAAAHGSDDVRLAVAVARASTLLYVGDPNGPAAAAALDPDVSSGERRRVILWAHLDFAAAAFNLGRYHESEAYLQTVRDSATPQDAEILDMALRTGELMLEWAAGRWDGLAERAAIHAQRTAGVPRWSIPGTLMGALLAEAGGEHAVAERLCRACLPEARSGGVVPAFSQALGILASIRLERGRADDAAEHAMRGVEALAAKGLWVWSHTVLPAAVAALLACNRVPEARALVESAAAGLAGRDAPAAAAAVHLGTGQLAEHGGKYLQAAGAYAEAERQFSALPHPWFAAQARALCGTCLLLAKRSDGGAMLEDALATFRSLGATAGVSRTFRSLRRYSIATPVQWRGGRAGYGKSLSPRESEVARLAADGLTNPEIGRQLFLSPRTVEHHLASVMHKLAVKTRIELAHKIREQS